MKLRENMVMAATLLAVLLCMALLGLYVFQKTRAAQERMAVMEPRYARLLGLEMQRGDMSASLEQALQAREKYVYPRTQDAAQAGNAAQQRLRDIFQGAGLQIISSQVLPSKIDKGYERIPLTIRVEGGMLGLQSALAVLSSQLPVIMVNDLEVQLRSGPPNAEPYLAIQFNLNVLRERT